MKLKSKITAITLSAFTLTGGISQGAVSFLFTGDPEGAGGLVTTNWFDSAPAFTSWDNAGGPTGFGGNLTTDHIALGNSGWVYRSIGTTEAGDTALDWSMLIGAESGQTATVSVQFYSGNPTGTAADGTAISTIGLSTLGSAETISGTGAESTQTGTSIDVSGLAAGTQVWMEITSTSAPFAGVDNITVNAVPEPSSAILLGLGGLTLILRRRI